MVNLIKIVWTWIVALFSRRKALPAPAPINVRVSPRNDTEAIRRLRDHVAKSSAEVRPVRVAPNGRAVGSVVVAPHPGTNRHVRRANARKVGAA